jgi:hypothetical protein
MQAAQENPPGYLPEIRSRKSRLLYRVPVARRIAARVTVMPDVDAQQNRADQLDAERYGQARMGAWRDVDFVDSLTIKFIGAFHVASRAPHATRH